MVKVVRKKLFGDWKMLLTLTYTSITFNDVDLAVSAPPQAVRELAKKGKTTPGS